MMENIFSRKVVLMVQIYSPRGGADRVHTVTLETFPLSLINTAIVLYHFEHRVSAQPI